MKTSEHIDKLIDALVHAQAAFAVADKDTANPFFKSKYADLAAINSVTQVPLATNGLAMVQPASFVDGRVVITTRLMHKTGQWLESELSLKPDKDTPQAIGSAITYARRYAKASMLGIVQDDDDGNAASGNSDKKYKPASQEAVVQFTEEQPIPAIKSKPAMMDTDKEESKPKIEIFSKNNKAMVDKLRSSLKNLDNKTFDKVTTYLNNKIFTKKTVNEAVAAVTI